MELIKREVPPDRLPEDARIDVARVAGVVGIERADCVPDERGDVGIGNEPRRFRGLAHVRLAHRDDQVDGDDPFPTRS